MKKIKDIKDYIYVIIIKVGGFNVLFLYLIGFLNWKVVKKF